MTPKTISYPFQLVAGVPVIVRGGHRIVVDTCAPASVHTSPQLEFLDTTFAVKPDSEHDSIAALYKNFGSPVTTVLGTDILRKYQVVFDYQQSTITFHRDCPPAMAGEVIRLKSFRGLPVVPAFLGGQAIPMLLVTGARLSYVHRSHTQGYLSLGETTDFYPTLGRFATNQVQLPTSVGCFTFQITYGHLPNSWNRLLSLVMGDNGFLGSDFFKQFRVCLDLDRRKMTLQKYDSWVIGDGCS
jgi:hypothetical protein